MTTRNIGSSQRITRSSFLSKPRIRHLLHRYRRPLAIVLGTCAVLVATAAVRPSPEPTTTVLIANRAIKAGHTLGQDDLAISEWPVTLGARSTYFSNAEQAIGRMTAGPVSEGEPLNAGRIVGPSLLDSSDLTSTDSPNRHMQAPETQEVAAIVRLADKAYLALTRPGDYVDILGADAQTMGDFERETPSNIKQAPRATVLAEDARVLAIPGNDSETGIGAAVGVQSQNSESVVVLAVDPETASTLAGGSTRYRMSMVVKPRPVHLGQ